MDLYLYYNWISISDLIIDIDYNSLMQISISLKYIITISFISTIFISKKVHLKNSILFYTTLWSFVLLSIFYFDFFPVCFTKDQGLTSFYSISLYLNLSLMTFSYLIFKFKSLSNISDIDKNIMRSIWYFIISQVFFLCKKGGLFFITGYAFKLVCYFIFLKTIINSSIYNPIEILLDKSKSLNLENLYLNYTLNRGFLELENQDIDIFSSALEVSPNETLIMSTEGDILFKNKSFENLCGVPQDLFNKESLDKIQELINTQVTNVKVDINDFLVLQSSNGSYREDWFLKDGKVLNICISFIKDDFYSQLILVDIVDITEKSNEINKMKSELILTMSHELKTPLNIILGSVQLMESSMNTITEDQISQSNKIIKNNCYRLVKFSNNIIDVLKIESNTLKLQKNMGNIVSYIEELLDFVRPITNLKYIKLIFDTDIEEKFLLYDKEKIERVLLNLLSNAIKFSQINGEIFVQVEDGIDFITITVRDNGIGIPQSISYNIFDKFNKFHSGLIRPAEGIGLGLFITKSFVELHGGTIDVDRSQTNGSSFIFTLPVHPNLDGLSEYLDLKSEIRLDNVSIELSDI